MALLLICPIFAAMLVEQSAKASHLDTPEGKDALWQRFKEGDRQAFEALIRQHYAGLFQYGLRFTKDKALLKDVVHDAFIKIWQARHTLHVDREPYFYLLTIFRNHLVKCLKPTLLLSEEPLAQLIAEPVETQWIHREETDRVQDLLQRLPARHQEALHLRFFEELDNEQIAKLMGIHKQSVANLLHSALKLLREMWALTLMMFYWI